MKINGYKIKEQDAQADLGAGFTLLEVVVSLGIIALILTLSMVSYRRSNSRNAIIMAAYQVAGDARLSQSYAASARQYSDQPKWNVWGVYFDTANKKEYKIFVDKNANGYYDGAGDDIWRTVKLPANITLKTVKLYKGAVLTPSAEVSVVYFPPSPSSSIATLGGTQYDEARITLQDGDNLSTKDITVNFFGLVDVTY